MPPTLSLAEAYGSEAGRVEFVEISVCSVALHPSFDDD